MTTLQVGPYGRLTATENSLRQERDALAEYEAAEKAWNSMLRNLSVPPTSEQVAVARRFVQASRYRYRRPSGSRAIDLDQPGQVGDRP